MRRPPEIGAKLGVCPHDGRVLRLVEFLSTTNRYEEALDDDRNQRRESLARGFFSASKGQPSRAK